MAEHSSSQDPFLNQYNPFQHPLVWCLQDFLQQQRAGAGSSAEHGVTGGSLQDTFVKSHELQAAAKVRVVQAYHVAADTRCGSNCHRLTTQPHANCCCCVDEGTLSTYPD